MKKILFAFVIALTASVVAISVRFAQYIRVTDRLLEDCELICEENGILWGDTLCEGDSWSDFQEMRTRLHLEQF